MSITTHRGGGSGGGANKALSNLANIAINAALIPDGDGTRNLGSPSASWANAYINQIQASGNVDSPEFYNSSGMLKIQPDVQGDVELFGDTDVPDIDNGKMLYVRRQAAEGNDYMRMYISAGRIAYLHSNRNLTLQGQINFTINSVTENVFLKVGDNAGVKKFYFQDSDSADIATIDSNGNADFVGNVTGANLNITDWDTAYGWGDHAGLYQGADATLTAFASLLTGANKIPYATAADIAAELDLATTVGGTGSDTTLVSEQGIREALDLAAPVIDPTFTNDVVIDGFLGIGDSNPNFKIDAYINRTSGIIRCARFITDGNHVDARGISIRCGEDTESGTNYWLEAYDGDGGINTGGLRSVAGVFDVYNASDRRLKQNIKNTTMTGKDIINKLIVRDFEWKTNPGRKVTGLISQEVKEIYPDAVGEPDHETGMYAISMTPLIPPIIKCIQELEARITELELKTR